MTAQLAPPPVFRSWDNLGLPLVGGKLNTYIAGTTTPQATYTDSTQGTPNTNPVILNFRGEAFVWLDPSLTYKFVLTDAFGNLIWTEDNIAGGFGANPLSTNLIPNPSNTFTLGNSTHSWANVYLGPSAVPAFDPVSGNIGYYARTSAEIAAAVTPTNFSYQPGDMRRYGVDLTGANDSTTAMQNCINCSAGAYVFMPNGTYKFTALTGITGMRVTGQSRAGVILNASTSGIAFDCYGLDNIWLENFTLNTSNVAATGMRFGNGCRSIGLKNIRVAGSGAASNTGTGLLLQSGSPGLFSGNLLAQLFYSFGYKFGIQCTGVSIGTNTWTSMSFLQCFVVGNFGAPIAGSIGLWMDANTNGVGSSFLGGTIEGYSTGLQCDNGSFGLDFCADNEGNTIPYTVGATFQGRIKNTSAIGDSYEASANSSTNRWYTRKQLNGVLIDESWFEYDVVIYDNGGAGPFSVYRGASLANGGSPTLKFQIATGNSSGDAGPARNYILCPPGVNKISFWAASPNSGTAAVGDIAYNTAVAVGQPNGWRCTVAGSPGTWVAMNNL